LTICILPYIILIVVATTTWASELGRIAQLGEHLPYKQGVTGSSPVVPTILYEIRPSGSVGLECRPVTPEVEGSNPFWVAKSGQIAQSVEQRTENPRVPGSIPGLATNY
jgi:hypothetical protein